MRIYTYIILEQVPLNNITVYDFLSLKITCSSKITVTTPITKPLPIIGRSTAGLTPVCVMLVSAVIMAICGILSKKLKLRWLTDYALPLSLIGGMAAAIPLAELLGYEVIK